MRLVLTIAISVATVLGQAETLSNSMIVEMSRAGLPPEIILKKIDASRAAFDVSAQALIDLKKAGVDDSVLVQMLDICQKNAARCTGSPGIDAGQKAPAAPSGPITTGIESIPSYARPKTIAFIKSSLHPSRQALEKELMKRRDFQSLDLTILRYKEQADLFVEIGYVSGSWITHRYVYRIYDRRSGSVIGAGETTSWGSLAENLARNISRSLQSAKVSGS